MPESQQSFKHVFKLIVQFYDVLRAWKQRWNTDKSQLNVENASRVINHKAEAKLCHHWPEKITPALQETALRRSATNMTMINLNLRPTFTTFIAGRQGFTC